MAGDKAPPALPTKRIALQPEKPDRSNAHYCQKNNRYSGMDASRVQNSRTDFVRLWRNPAEWFVFLPETLSFVKSKNPKAQVGGMPAKTSRRLAHLEPACFKSLINWYGSKLIPTRLLAKPNAERD
jgi:hypothetical protein